MKIVDLSCDVAGRFAAKLLAMAGDDVTRPATTDAPHPQDTLSLYLDAGKKIAAASHVTARLKDADVVFSSFDQGRYQGLAADGLSLPSACVHVTTSTFGTSGPYARWRGGPLVEWSAGGYFAITGDPDRAPLIGPEHLCAYLGGYTAAIAAEAALRGRERDGKGRHIDISTMEAMLCLHQSTFARLGAGVVRERTGRYAEVYPLTVRPCRDGFVSLGVVTDSEFDRLAIAMEQPQLASDPRFETQAARWQNRDALDAELHAFLSVRDADDVVAHLQANDVAATKVATPADVLENPQLAARDYWAEAQGARMPGNPIPAATVFAQDAAPPRPLTSAALPLADITVLDLTALWAGPSATRCLADLGADVIWIERPRSRLDAETSRADPRAVMQHMFHTKMNRGKRSIVLDLESAAGRAAAQQLARKADVLIENFRPGTAARLGLGPQELCAANPGLVYVSLSGFGSNGPWGAWRSYGPNLEAASSIEARTGYASGEPMRLGHALPDGVGGLAGALAALRGLRERQMRGRGGWFDISQLEVYTAICGEDILAASLRGRSFPRIGNRSRTGAIQGAFPCRGRDQWITIRLADAHDVERFTAATKLEAVRTLAAVQPHDDDAIEEIIGAFTATQDKLALAQALQNAGLEAIAILTSQDLVADPHLGARNFFVEIEIAGRTYCVPGSPFHADRPLIDTSRRAPRFGEHTAAVLAGLS